MRSLHTAAKSSPCSPQLEKPVHSNEDPTQPKKKKKKVPDKTLLQSVEAWGFPWEVPLQRVGLPGHSLRSGWPTGWLGGQCFRPLGPAGSLVDNGRSTKKPIRHRDFPGGLVVKNPPSSAGDRCSIPGPGTKIPHTVGQLSPRAPNYRGHAPWSLSTTTTEATRPGA